MCIRDRFLGDVAIRGDRIVRVSRLRLRGGPQTRVIEATGKVVAPGFIDLHAHLEPLLTLPGAESHVRQGVTLAVGGPDGGGPLPLAAYLDSVTRGGGRRSSSCRSRHRPGCRRGRHRAWR